MVALSGGLVELRAVGEIACFGASLSEEAEETQSTEILRVGGDGFVVWHCTHLRERGQFR